MARLILADGLDRQAKRHDWLRALLYRFEAAIVLSFWWTFRVLPVERAAALGRFVVGWFGPRSGRAGFVTSNLSIAFPSLGPAAVARLARGTWRNIGSVFGEYPNLEQIARAGPDSRLEIDDRCGLDVYARSERSAVFVGAHLANWELMGLALAREGVPVLGFYGPLQNPYFSALVKRMRAERRYRMLERGQSMRAVIQQVRAGGSLGILLAIPAKDGIEVPFFGQPMHLAATPARMALRYGCDIVPVRTRRIGEARFSVTVYPRLTLADAGAGADEATRTLAVMRQLNALMEEWIREEPDQWMCASRRWDKGVYRALEP